jgi:hypothetical protein
METETFAERRRLFARQQRRFIALIGPCLIAATTIIALGAGTRARHEPFPALVAFLLGGLALILTPMDSDRPRPKLLLFGTLCALVFAILVLL